MTTTSFFSPQRPHPAPKIPSEPAFWIEEIQLLKSLDDKKDSKIREPIILTKGLNIIWAPTTAQKDRDKNEFDGHAAGKTTFCRLVRYVLGEDFIAAPGVKEAIAEAFPNGWIVAKINFPNFSWIVARPFHPQTRPRGRCLRANSINDLLAAPQKGDSMDAFLEDLHHTIVAPLPVKLFGDGQTDIELNHLLQWLARDQECRYTRLNEFRHPDSASGSPKISGEAGYFLQRIVLDLADQDLQKAITKCEKLEVRKNTLPAEKEYQVRRETELNALLENAELKKKSDPRLSKLDFQPARDALETKRKAALSNLTEARKIAVCVQDDHRNTIASSREELGSINLQVTQALQDKNEAQERLDALTGKKRDEELDQKQSSKRPSIDFCRVPADFAKTCPKFLEWNVQDDNEDKSEEILSDLKTATEKHLFLCNQNHLGLIQTQTDLKNKIQVAETKVGTVQHKIDEHDEKLTQAKKPFITLSDQIDELEQVSSKVEKLHEEEKQLNGEVKDAQHEQEELQKRHRKQEGRFIEEFAWTIFRIFGGSADDDRSKAEGSCSFTRETITAKVNYRGRDLSSSAVTTIKILCFDLAALSLSCRGYGNHPRFLIHDSPREADMGPALYGRYFDLIAEHNAETDTFQHIITTTSEPPPEFQKLPFLRLILRTSPPENRLFKTDL